MKKNYYGKVLALTLAASMVSVPAFAEENIIREDNSSSMSKDENFLEDEDTDIEPSLQDRIDALPTVEELEVMTAEELEAVSAEVEEIYAALEESEDAADLNMEKLQAVADFFTGAVEEQKIDGIVVSTEAELRAAIAQAEGTEKNPTVIHVATGIDLSSTLELSDKHIKLIGATDSVELKATDSTNLKTQVINLNKSSDLILENIVLNANSVQKQNVELVNRRNLRVLAVRGDSTLTLNEGAVVKGGSEWGGGIYLPSGTVNIEGGSVTENIDLTGGDNNCFGGGILVNGGTLNLISGYITDNTSTDGGAGVAILNGIFNMYGGEISENTSEKAGAGVRVFDNNTFNMYGGKITKNTTRSSAVTSGAGVFYSATSQVTLNGKVEIYDNYPNVENIKTDISTTNADKGITITGSITDSNVMIAANDTVNTKVAVGTDTYKLTKEDLAAFTNTLDGYALYLDTAENAIKAGGAHTVTLNANYGDNAETKEVKGAKISLSADIFTREGYVLTGWNTSADGTGAPYTDSFMPTGDTTLYAQWKEAVQVGGFLDEAEQVRWSFDEKSGTLKISGKGDIKAFTEAAGRPYNTYTEKITNVDVSEFDTSEVTSMAFLFAGLKNVTSLDLSGFNTSKVTDMHNMFQNTTSLESLDLSSFDTSNVTSMNRMFHTCMAKTINLSSFNTSNVSDMIMMFYSCGVETLDVSRFDTSKANIQQMFQQCEKLKSLDLSNFSLANTKGLNSMFYHCYALEQLNLSGFDTSNVTTMEAMFWGCTSLKTLDVSHFNTTQVTNMGSMFRSCYNLESLNINGFDTSNVTDMPWMFGNDIAATGRKAVLDLSHLQINAATNVSSMFTNYNTLQEVKFGDKNENKNITLPDNFGDITKAPVTILPKGTSLPSGSGTYLKNPISITYNENIGEDSEEKVQYASAGEFDLQDNTFVREGYIFLGWKVNNSGDLIANEATVEYSSDVVLYAQWVENNGTSGFCGADEDGKNVAWSFNTANGMLTLTGAGAMKDFTLDGNNWDKTVDCPWEKYRDNIKSVSIDEKITHLGSYAFVNYKNLSYDITDLVNKANEGKLTFGKSVFDSCGNVTGHNLYINFNTSRACFSGTGIDGILSFGPDVEYIGRDEEAKDNVGYTFRNCQKITKLDFSKATGLKAIYGRSFENMKGVTEIVFPENFVYKLNDDAYMDYAFNGNTNMKGSFDDVIFDITCKSGHAAEVFNTCANMTGNVHFTDTTTIIPESMFKATGATSVTISKNITTVNKNAFHACSKLAAIDAIAVNQAITYNDDAFTGIADKSGAYFSTKERADEFKLATNAYDASKTFVAVTNGGTFAENTVFTAGKFATPAKEDFVFGGWFETEDCSGTAVTAPTAGKTYYAKWTRAGNLMATAKGFTGDYDGIEHTVTITPSAEDAAVTYSVDGGKTYSAVKPQFKNAGTYTVHYKVSKEGCLDVTGSAVVQINKIKNPVTITPSTTSLRGGGTVTFTITAPEGVTINDVICSDESIAVAKGEDGKYTVTLPAGVAEYTFTVYADGDLINNSYDDATTTVSVTRKKSGSSSNTSAPTYGVSTGKTENGTISVTPAKAETGETVTIKATPDNGYQLDKVTVKDKNNGNVKLTKVDDNEYTFTMPNGKVSVDAIFVQKDAADDNQNNAGETSKVIKLQIGSRIVTVDNEAVIYDVAPVIRNDRTLVPIRVVTETLGGKVGWNGVTKEVTLNIDGKEIKMTVGKTLEKYGVAPVIIDGRTFVPVRFVADELGATVAWDDATKTVTVTK